MCHVHPISSFFRVYNIGLQYWYQGSTNSYFIVCSCQTRLFLGTKIDRSVLLQCVLVPKGPESIHALIVMNMVCICIVNQSLLLWSRLVFGGTINLCLWSVYSHPEDFGLVRFMAVIWIRIKIRPTCYGQVLYLLCGESVNDFKVCIRIDDWSMTLLPIPCSYNWRSYWVSIRALSVCDHVK